MIGEVVILSTVVSAVVSYVTAKTCYREPKAKEELVTLPGGDVLSLNPAVSFEEKVAAIQKAQEMMLSPISVSGVPPRVPWRIRKHEREQAARTKRKAMQEGDLQWRS